MVAYPPKRPNTPPVTCAWHCEGRKVKVVAPVRASAKEAGLAQTVEGLFDLDLAGLDAWTESQKTDLRTCLSYMREVLKNKAMLTTSLTTGKQRRAVPKGRGFGGGGAGKAKSKAKPKGPKKRKR